jgi:ribokinase
MMGKVGQDEDGDFILKEMALISRRRIGRDHRTGQALIILGPDRDRIILLLPNANRELSWEDLEPDFVKTFRILHMTSILGKGLALQERLAREVAGQVQISFDPGEVYVQRGLKDLAPLLSLCHFLFITQGELELLAGRDWRDGVKEIMDLGTRIIAVKKKGSGAFLQGAAGIWELPAPVIQAKDTTGAGDVFAAGFLGGYLRGLPLPACGSLGLTMAHQSMAGVGREAYPNRKDFETAAKRMG